MNYVKRVWQYLLVQPFTWIFYCFFQPARFKRDIEIKGSLERIVPMVRLVLPIFLLSYPLALVVRMSVYQSFSGSVVPDFLLDAARTTIVVILGVVVLGITAGLELGIVIGVVMGMAAGVIGSVAGSIIWSILVIMTVSITRHIVGEHLATQIIGDGIAVRIIKTLSKHIVEAIVGGLAGSLIGSVLGGLAGAIVGSIMGAIIGVTMGNITEEIQGILMLVLIGSIAGSTLESFRGGVAVSIAGGIILGIVGCIEQDIGSGILYTLTVITIMAIGGVVDYGIENGLILAIVVGIASVIGYFIGYYRFPLYPISGFSSFRTYLDSQKNPLRVFTYLQHSSLYWDEYIFLPLPGLKGTLLIGAQQDTEQALEEIAFIVAARPQQVGAARGASLEIVIQDMEMRDTLRAIANFSERLTEILPPKTILIDPRWVTPFVQLNRVSREASHYTSLADWQARGDALEKIISDLKRVYPDTITNDARLRKRLRQIVDMWLREARSELERGEKAQKRTRTVEEVVASLTGTAHVMVMEDNATAFKQALEEYYGKYPNERLVFHEDDEILYYENPVQVAYAWQCWQTLKRLISSKEKSLPRKLLEDIVNLLVSSVFNTSSTRTLQVHNGSLFSTQLDVRQLFGSIRMPQQLPVILYTRSQFNENDAIELRALMKNIAPQSRLALILFFTESEYLKDAVRLLKDNLQRVYAFDFIPLDYRDFSIVIGNKDPQKAFRQLVFSQVDLNLISPFIISGPTSDPMFFGREHELLMITEHAATVNYALIGGRRIGKTSILAHLRDVGLPAADFRALYHDCSYTPSQSELVQSVALDKLWFPKSPDIRLTTFASVIQALPDDKPLVILLDEADALIAPDQSAGYPLLNTLRGFANAGRCHFVLSGEQSLRGNLRNPESPLYNFANEMLIGCLDFHAVQELVVQPMKQLGLELIGEAKIVQHIWNFTSGHPSIVQRLCQRLITRLNQDQMFRLTIDDVQAVIVDSDFLSKDFLNIYWEKATALERLCSLVIARNGRLRTLMVVHEALNELRLDATLNEVNDALERLVDLRNILQITPEGYKFVATAFPEVIAKTNQLDDLIALNSESYRREPYSQRSIQ